MTKPLSPVMATALAETIERGGELVRHQGGYWTPPGAVVTGPRNRPFEWWVEPTTIGALHRRQRVEFTEWRDGRKGRYPVRAKVVAEAAQ